MPKTFIYSVRNYGLRKAPHEYDDGETNPIVTKMLTRSVFQPGQDVYESLSPWHLGVSKRMTFNSRGGGAKDRRRESASGKSYHHLSLVTRFYIGLRMTRVQSAAQARRSLIETAQVNGNFSCEAKPSYSSEGMKLPDSPKGSDFTLGEMWTNKPDCETTIDKNIETTAEENQRATKDNNAGERVDCCREEDSLPLSVQSDMDGNKLTTTSCSGISDSINEQSLCLSMEGSVVQTTVSGDFNDSITEDADIDKAQVTRDESDTNSPERKNAKACETADKESTTSARGDRVILTLPLRGNALNTNMRVTDEVEANSLVLSKQRGPAQCSVAAVAYEDDDVLDEKSKVKIYGDSKSLKVSGAESDSSKGHYTLYVENSAVSKEIFAKGIPNSDSNITNRNDDACETSELAFTGFPHRLFNTAIQGQKVNYNTILEHKKLDSALKLTRPENVDGIFPLELRGPPSNSGATQEEHTILSTINPLRVATLGHNIPVFLTAYHDPSYKSNPTSTSQYSATPFHGDKVNFSDDRSAFEYQTSDLELYKYYANFRNVENARETDQNVFSKTGRPPQLLTHACSGRKSATLFDGSYGHNEIFPDLVTSNGKKETGGPQTGEHHTNIGQLKSPATFAHTHYRNTPSMPNLPNFLWPQPISPRDAACSPSLDNCTDSIPQTDTSCLPQSSMSYFRNLIPASSSLVPNHFLQPLQSPSSQAVVFLSQSFPLNKPKVSPNEVPRSRKVGKPIYVNENIGKPIYVNENIGTTLLPQMADTTCLSSIPLHMTIDHSNHQAHQSLSTNFHTQCPFSRVELPSDVISSNSAAQRESRHATTLCNNTVAKQSALNRKKEMGSSLSQASKTVKSHAASLVPTLPLDSQSSLLVVNSKRQFPTPALDLLSSVAKVPTMVGVDPLQPAKPVSLSTTYIPSKGYGEFYPSSNSIMPSPNFALLCDPSLSSRNESGRVPLENLVPNVFSPFSGSYLNKPVNLLKRPRRVSNHHFEPSDSECDLKPAERDDLYTPRVTFDVSSTNQAIVCSNSCTTDQNHAKRRRFISPNSTSMSHITFTAGDISRPQSIHLNMPTTFQMDKRLSSTGQRDMIHFLDPGSSYSAFSKFSSLPSSSVHNLDYKGPMSSDVNNTHFSTFNSNVLGCSGNLNTTGFANLNNNFILSNDKSFVDKGMLPTFLFNNTERADSIPSSLNIPLASISTNNGTSGKAGRQENMCPICFRLFTRSWLLKNHMRTHTGERPYHCPHPGCLKAFADRSNLRSHILTHSAPEKGFPCPRCGRCFSQKRYLHKHALEVCKIAGADS